MSRFAEIEAILTALGAGGTAADFEFALRDYPDRDVRTVLAERAAAGGGGGGPATAADLPFVPAGTVAATDVQAAIEEVASEAASFNGGTITDPLIVDSGDAGTQALTVDAGGANAKIARFQKSDGTAVVAFGSTSEFPVGVVPTLVVSPGEAAVALSDTGSGFNVQDSDGNTNFYVSPTGVVRIWPPAGSTDNPLDVRRETGGGALLVAADGTVYLGPSGAYMSVGGAIVLEQHSAPADGDLGAGECALWFDQTNGSAKLMVKAKSADGTVVTGSLALAP